MPPEVSFRLNGTIVPMVFVNRERVQGKLTGRWQIAVWIDGRGRFVIDNEIEPVGSDVSAASSGIPQ